MRIAILGGGFAGLALTWHILKKKPNYKVTVIDANGIGKGASGISAGLMHPYTGIRAKKSIFSDEGFNASLELLKIASTTVKEQVYIHNGLLRLPVDAEQEMAFKKCANENKDTFWLSEKECQNLVPGIKRTEGLFIEKSISVYPEKYLQGLWLACKALGAIFVHSKIKALSELNHYDRIITALGAGIVDFPELRTVRLNQLKGQILQIPWPQNLEPFSCSISSKIYLVIDTSKKFCYVGSTHEREFFNPEPDLKRASDEILPHLIEFCPAFKGIEPSVCKAGIRMTSPDYQPFIKKIDDRFSVFSGLGSKGLLYHALLAQNFVESEF